METERYSDSVVRTCSRCHRELTDAASREAGVGPVCRSKSNEIFSRTIPANLNVATTLFLCLSSDQFHLELQNDFDGIRKQFLKIMEKAQSASTNPWAPTVQGGDFRKVVDWFDYSLSFPCSPSHRERVVKIIEALGYVGLASVLRGDACMSPARIYIEGTQICLSGKSQKRGFLEMRRNIPSVKTPKWRGDKRPYRASVLYAEKFIEIAITHWPFIESNNEELENLRQEAAKLAVEAQKEESSTLPTAIFYRTLKGTMVHFPWVGTREEMMTTINGIKNIVPPKERRYNPEDHSWTFRDYHLEAVKEIVSKRYRVELNWERSL